MTKLYFRGFKCRVNAASQVLHFRSFLQGNICDSSLPGVQAIQNPGDLALQEKAWNAVCPLVAKLKRFYEFSLRLGEHVSSTQSADPCMRCSTGEGHRRSGFRSAGDVQVAMASAAYLSLMRSD